MLKWKIFHCPILLMFFLEPQTSVEVTHMDLFIYLRVWRECMGLSEKYVGCLFLQ